MATINYTAPDGSTHKIPLPEGGDPAAVVADFEAKQNFTAPLAAAATPGSVPPLDTTAEPRTVGESAVRGAGLAARVPASAALKLPTSLADLAASVLNVPMAGADMLFQALGDEPAPARLPTDATASADDFLNLIFPEPETFGERVVSGVGDIALTGGAGGFALAPRAAQVTKGASTQSILKNLGDEIGQSFAKNPKTAAALETSGAVGAETGATLAEDADAGPLASLVASLGGGLAGVLAPQTVVNTGKRAAGAVTETLDTVTKGETRAARALQDAAADPEAAAVAARNAPEGVSPARATEDPNLQSLEARVLEDDPALSARVASDLEDAETRTLTELADEFGPTSKPEDFQQAVIERAAAPGARIKTAQPDEMLDDAARSFDAAYAEAEGFPIQTQTINTEGGNVSLRESLTKATQDTNVIADKKVRKRVNAFLQARLEDVSRRGTRQDGVTQIDSSDVLEMRQAVRQQLRQKTRSGQNSADAASEAELLQNANLAITEALESQLPAEASAALRATDQRYSDFITVQTAVLRSGDKGLTPDRLKAAVSATAPSKGQVARGNTGDLGKLAETGRNPADTLGKPQEAARLTRNMTPEQLSTAKADFTQAIAQKATPGTTGRLDGKKLVAQLDQNAETLKAAGFSDAEISNVRRIGSELKMIQNRTPAAATALLEDNVGNVLRLLGAMAGSRGASRLLKGTGGGGAGPSLIVSQFGSKIMQDRLTGLSVDNANTLIRAAMDDKDLFAALLTKPTDTLKKQADAARAFNAFIVESTPDTEAE